MASKELTEEQLNYVEELEKVGGNLLEIRKQKNSLASTEKKLSTSVRDLFSKIKQNFFSFDKFSVENKKIDSWSLKNPNYILENLTPEMFKELGENRGLSIQWTPVLAKRLNLALIQELVKEDESIVNLQLDAVEKLLKKYGVKLDSRKYKKNTPFFKVLFGDGKRNDIKNEEKAEKGTKEVPTKMKKNSARTKISDFIADITSVLKD